MQVTLAGTGVRLSDGSTNEIPASDHPGEVHRVWALHAGHVRRSLAHGFFQGWDLHPSHLPSRFAAVYGFLLDGLDRAMGRVRAWNERSASGTRQSLRVINPFCTTRNAILVLIFSTEKPGLSFPTTKPLTWFEPSSRAQITLISANVALPSRADTCWPCAVGPPWCSLSPASPTVRRRSHG